MMEQLINFETSKLAKDKGFNVDSLYFYNEKGVLKFYGIDSEGYWNPKDFNSNYYGNHSSAPTQSLLQKWLRDTHNSFVLPVPGIDGMQGDWMCSIMRPGKQPFEDFIESTNNKTYEEALEKGLQEALKLLK